MLDVSRERSADQRISTTTGRRIANLSHRGYTGDVARCGTAAFRVREAVFSSTGFRIRAAQPTAATAPVASLAERIAASLFFTFFPADCRICSAPLIQISRLPVCEDCVQEPRPLHGIFCGVCGEACDFPAGLDQADARCRLCRKSHPPFDRAVAYGSYDGALRDLIHLLKFDQVRPIAPVLGRMLAETISALEPSLPLGTIAIVPVPLYSKKKAQRGFNQADVIARAALKQLARREQSERQFELIAGVLVRSRDTGSQIGLSRHQRRENLRGAFHVSDAAQILKRNILLIDDVYTTGAMASECARVLRRAGAARVWVATVARTLKISDALAISEDLSWQDLAWEKSRADGEDGERASIANVSRRA
jgi:ComF family protein